MENPILVRLYFYIETAQPGLNLFTWYATQSTDTGLDTDLGMILTFSAFTDIASFFPRDDNNNSSARHLEIYCLI